MKNQKHNQGDLKELTINIETQLVDDIAKMSKNSKLSQDDIVAIAVKRFRASHADYMKEEPDPL